jgi:hypothetical protein
LAARSPFFASLLSRHTIPLHKRTMRQVQITLDESVFAYTYAPVVVHAFYSDEICLDKLIKGHPQITNCLTEVQAIASGKCHISPIDQVNILSTCAALQIVITGIRSVHTWSTA